MGTFCQRYRLCDTKPNGIATVWNTTCKRSPLSNNRKPHAASAHACTKCRGSSSNAQKISERTQHKYAQLFVHSSSSSPVRHCSSDDIAVTASPGKTHQWCFVWIGTTAECARQIRVICSLKF